MDWAWSQCCTQCYNKCCRIGKLWSSETGSFPSGWYQLLVGCFHFSLFLWLFWLSCLIFAQTILKIPGFSDNVFTHLLSGLGAGFFAVCIGSPVDVVCYHWQSIFRYPWCTFRRKRCWIYWWNKELFFVFSKDKAKFSVGNSNNEFVTEATDIIVVLVMHLRLLLFLVDRVLE